MSTLKLVTLWAASWALAFLAFAFLYRPVFLVCFDCGGVIDYNATLEEAGTLAAPLFLAVLIYKRFRARRPHFDLEDERS